MLIFDTNVTTQKVKFNMSKTAEVCQALDLNAMIVTPGFYVLFLFS